jgi:amidohydrolase
MIKQEKLSLSALKAYVVKEIDYYSTQLRDLSLRIHSNPELAFHEVKAVGWLTQFLESHGFSVERGICNLPTAFKASYGQGKPVIAILAEYDALPKLGHACGHNLIAGTAVSAGISSKYAIDQFGGTIIVMGTPAEEMYGGKAIMAERGAFNNVDIAMMVHPGQYNSAITYALAANSLEVEFFGKAAHAAMAPEEGINALEALILSFTAINSLRQHIKDNTRVHGIITDGGEAANIVPAHSAANFLVRAHDDMYLSELKERVLNCFIAAAKATGARLKYKWGDVQYATMYNNLVLARLFSQNMHSLGRVMKVPDPSDVQGSIDMGNVSHLVPSIHCFVRIASSEVIHHTPQFAVAASSDAGIEGMLDGAKALSKTVIDLLNNPKLVKKAKNEFQHIGSTGKFEKQINRNF